MGAANTLLRYQAGGQRRAAAALLVLGLVGCSQQGRLLVVVDGDITTRAELDTVEVRVRRSAIADGESTTFVLSRDPLPLRLGVEPVGGAGLVRVEAVGLRDGIPLIGSLAVVNIQPGPTRVLQLYLDGACAGILECGDGRTCIDGTCQAVPIVEPPDLPTLDSWDAGPAAGPRDGGRACPAFCEGCCESGTCQLGTEASACGVRGESCVACPTGFTCTGGVCLVDEASAWAIVLDRLEVPGTTLGGVEWDSTTCAVLGPRYCPPDPYVEIYVGMGATTPRATTTFVDDTTTLDFVPPYAVAPVRGGDVRSFVLFRVLDDDNTQPDEQIGSCSITGLTDADFRGVPIEATCPTDAASNNHGFTLRWHLEPR